MLCGSAGFVVSRAMLLILPMYFPQIQTTIRVFIYTTCQTQKTECKMYSQPDAHDSLEILIYNIFRERPHNSNVCACFEFERKNRTTKTEERRLAFLMNINGHCAKTLSANIFRYFESSDFNFGSWFLKHMTILMKWKRVLNNFNVIYW